MDCSVIAEKARAFLSYNFETGSFTRVETNEIEKGATIDVGGREFNADELAILWVKGVLPKEKVLHLDGDNQNNKWKNLLEVDSETYIESKKLFLEFPTIKYDSVSAEWTGYILFNECRVNIGWHKSIKSATSKYKEMASNKSFYENKWAIEKPNKGLNREVIKKRITAEQKARVPKIYTDIKRLTKEVVLLKRQKINYLERVNKTINDKEKQIYNARQESYSIAGSISWDKEKVDAVIQSCKEKNEKKIDEYYFESSVGAIPIKEIETGALFVPYLIKTGEVEKTNMKVRGKYIKLRALSGCYSHPKKQGTKCYVLEEVLVVEQHFSRYLKEFEVVHHINGDIDDNSIQNLRLFENYQARNTQLSVEALEKKGLSERKIKQILIDNNFKISVVAEKLHIAQSTLKKYFPKVFFNEGGLGRKVYLKGGDLDECIYFIGEVIRKAKKQTQTNESLYLDCEIQIAKVRKIHGLGEQQYIEKVLPLYQDSLDKLRAKFSKREPKIDYSKTEDKTEDKTGVDVNVGIKTEANVEVGIDFVDSFVKSCSPSQVKKREKLLESREMGKIYHAIQAYIKVNEFISEEEVDKIEKNYFGLRNIVLNFAKIDDRINELLEIGLL